MEKKLYVVGQSGTVLSTLFLSFFCFSVFSFWGFAFSRRMQMYNFLFLHTPHKVDPLSNGASIAKMCFYLVRCQHKYCWHGERRVIEEHYLSAKECTFRFSHTTHFCRHLSSQWSSLQVNIFDLALVQIHSVLAFFLFWVFFCVTFWQTISLPPHSFSSLFPICYFRSLHSSSSSFCLWLYFFCYCTLQKAIIH